MPASNDLDALFTRLSQSSFRQRFHLKDPELSYLHRKGMTTVMQHAQQFIESRLAPAFPANDGKQTPWRNHPVFVAQHATATCCRGCLERWHGIAKGQALTDEEIRYVLAVIECWLKREGGDRT